MERSMFEKLGRNSGDEPLSAEEVKRFRAMALLYPVVAVVAVLFFGATVGKLAIVTVFFAAWVAMQLVVLNPSRRRQVLGLPEIDPATTER